MTRHLKWPIRACVYTALSWLWHVTDRLTGDAVYGWIESAISDRFGLESPSVQEVVHWSVQLTPPLAATFLVLWIYHLWWLGGQRDGKLIIQSKSTGVNSISIVISIIILLSGPILLTVWPMPGTEAPPKSEKGSLAGASRPLQGPRSLESLFGTDFNTVFKLSDDGFRLQRKDRQSLQVEETVAIKINVYEDFQSNGLFVAFYVPQTSHIAFFCRVIADNLEEMIRSSLESVHVSVEQLGALAETKDSELKFTGRVYIYHESSMTLREQADVQDAFARIGANVQFRSKEYTMSRWLDQKLKQNASK